MWFKRKPKYFMYINNDMCRIKNITRVRGNGTSYVLFKYKEIFGSGYWHSRTLDENEFDNRILKELSFEEMKLDELKK